MDIRELLIDNNSELKMFVETDQYKLSRTMMKIRARLSLDTKVLSEKLNMSFEDYIKFESGNINIPTESYNNIVDKMINLLNEYRDEQLLEELNKNLNSKVNYNAEQLQQVSNIDKICLNNSLMFFNKNDYDEYSTSRYLAEVA